MVTSDLALPCPLLLDCQIEKGIESLAVNSIFVVQTDPICENITKSDNLTISLSLVRPVGSFLADLYEKRIFSKGAQDLLCN